MRWAALAIVACALAACGGDGEAPAATTKWRALSPATLERTEVAAARVGRFVYVMGGFEKSLGRRPSR